MNYNSMHAAGQVWGAILLVAALAALVASGSWGALGFIAALTPLVAIAERGLYSSRGTEK